MRTFLALFRLLNSGCSKLVSVPNPLRDVVTRLRVGLLRQAPHRKESEVFLVKFLETELVLPVQRDYSESGNGNVRLTGIDVTTQFCPLGIRFALNLAV